MRSRDQSCEPRVPIKSQTILAFDILRCDFCPRHNENLTYLYWCLTVVQSPRKVWTAVDCYWSGQSPQSPQRRTCLLVLSSAMKKLRDLLEMRSSSSSGVRHGVRAGRATERSHSMLDVFGEHHNVLKEWTTSCPRSRMMMSRKGEVMCCTCRFG